MGIFYDNDEAVINESDLDMDAIEEMFLADDVSRMNSDQIAEFCAEGGVGQALVEAGRMAKSTFVRLSKQDDAKRRRTIVALQMAKKANDPMFAKLVKAQALKKELVAKIVSKYGTKATKVAKVAQAKYIKNMKKVPVTMDPVRF